MVTHTKRVVGLLAGKTKNLEDPICCVSVEAVDELILVHLIATAMEQRPVHLVEIAAEAQVVVRANRLSNRQKYARTNIYSWRFNHKYTKNLCPTKMCLWNTRKCNFYHKILNNYKQIPQQMSHVIHSMQCSRGRPRFCNKTK